MSDPEYLVLEDIVQMYTAETGPQLLDGHDWDLVIDAIDDIPTKAALLAQCMKLNVRVISCMGAGGKSDVLVSTFPTFGLPVATLWPANFANPSNVCYTETRHTWMIWRS
ncbi:ThiF family [Fragilaria crotonensis]|nr:ThiF family [Fragilaria crotonensis]